jgi:bifunctional non-homologous end joining protein LigD
VPPAGPERGRSAPRAPQALPLPLPFEAAPDLPARVEPERATPCSAAFDDPDWRFSVEWAGMRAVLAVSADGAVRIHDERLRDVTAQLPEVAGCAAAVLRGRAAVLDGVVAALDADGCPDLSALARRLWSGAPAPRTAPPVALLVTDLLHLDGASLLAWPFDRRREALAGLLDPAPHIQVPEWVVGEGMAIADAAAQRGLPAVLARHGRAPYHAGVASPQRLRVALRDEADCVVCGAVTAARGTTVEALLLAEWEGGHLVDSGRVPVVEPDARRALSSRIASLRAPGRTVADAPAAEPGTVWLIPSLVATVRHHGRGADGRLRLPSLLAVRDDIDPECCRRRDPLPPPAGRAVESGGFRPTVLATLPLGD